MPRARPEPPVKRRLRPGHGDGHTRARTHETCEATPPWCVVGDCGYPGCAPGGPIEHCSPTAGPEGERRVGAIDMYKFEKTFVIASEGKSVLFCVAKEQRVMREKK